MARSRTTWTRDQAASHALEAGLRAGLVHSARGAARARAAAVTALHLDQHRYPGQSGLNPAPGSPVAVLSRAVANEVLARTAANPAPAPTRTRTGRRSRPGPAPSLVLEYADTAASAGESAVPAIGAELRPNLAQASASPVTGPSPAPVQTKVSASPAPAPAPRQAPDWAED